MSAYQSNLMWLQNRLSGSDNWCSKSAAMMLDRQVLASIKDAFHTMESQVKLRLILSLFHLSHIQIEEFSQELSEILQQAVTDRDQWTSTVARIMVTLYSPDYLDSLKNANQYLADFFNNVTEAGTVETVLYSYSSTAVITVFHRKDPCLFPILPLTKYLQNSKRLLISLR